jgi:hypothetical protein
LQVDRIELGLETLNHKKEQARHTAFAEVLNASNLEVSDILENHKDDNKAA